jgi:RHS repeat-associated protein
MDFHTHPILDSIKHHGRLIPFWRRVIRIQFVLVIVLLFGVRETGIAQTDPNAGILPFSVQLGGPYDFVNPATSAITIIVPVRSKSGKIPFSFSLAANSHAFLTITSHGIYWAVDKGFKQATPFPSAGAPPAIQSFCNGNTNQPDYTYNNFYVVDQTGATHPLPNGGIDEIGCNGYPTSRTAMTQDGSGYTLQVSATPPVGYAAVIYDRSGNNLSTSGTLPCVTNKLADPDGVQVSGSLDCNTNLITYTDTLEAPVLKASANSSFGPSPNTFTYTDASGNNQTVTVSFTTYAWQQTVFGCGQKEIQSPNSSFPTSITIPGVGTLGISYEQTPGKGNTYTTGRIGSLAYPDGETVSYTYSGGNNGVNCNSGVVPILTRTITDAQGHIEGKWTYVNSNNGSFAYLQNFTVTETDLAGNNTVYSFSGGIETEVQTYHGLVSPSNLLMTRITCYNAKFASCPTPSTFPYDPNNPKPMSQTDVYTYLGNSKSASVVETKFNTTGTKAEVKQYDIGAAPSLPPSGPPTGTPVFDEILSYNNWNGASCGPLANYIYDRVCVDTIVGASNGMLSQLKYTYDAAGHGHPVTTSKFVGGSAYLSLSASYNANGTPSTVKDANGTVTTYAYNGVGGCNGIFPTSLTITGTGLPTGGLTSSTQWDCNGGVITKTIDANKNPTGYGYVSQGSQPDPRWRTLSVTDPLNYVTWTTYTPAASGTPATVEKALTFNNNSSTVDGLTTIDAFGRVGMSENRTSPGSSGFDNIVQYGYGWTSKGPFMTKTIPSGTSGTTTQLDALGRIATITDGGRGTTTYCYGGTSGCPSSSQDVLVTLGPAPSGENTKMRQYEYDGLGRLTSVCEILASGGTPCGQSSAASGYRTSYAYSVLAAGGSQLVVTQGAQKRTYIYDGLTRLTSETNPESGTTVYTYDSDSSGTCPGTYKGDLVKRVDNALNVTCYTYDGLHRKLSASYSGPNTTANRYFVYDAASVNGNSMANAKGRMAEAYTATSVTGSKITDEGFGYTARGELSDFYESTPHSGDYYYVPMTYWANGLLETFGPFLTEDQMGFVPDSEGRAGAVHDFYYGSNPVPSITYNAASQPTQAMTSCLGSTCYPITYQYDPNTLRMTQYSAALNGGTISGTLTWNPNGSLQQLTIADPFNGADVQNCTYNADDLGRIASVNCMNGSTSVWAQNFSYDAFGNLTKSGSISWMPGYNSSTNQYTLAGTSYDANGNLLNDTFNKYTWDAERKVLSTAYIEGGGENWAFTYDAFGHKVELSVNGSYRTSYVTLGNFKLTAVGQSPNYSEYPFPGGSMLSELGGSTGVQLGDWLGTSRAFWSYTGGGFSQSGAHAPFGESYSYNGGYPEDFTGQPNDGNMTNTTYYFPERQYRSSQGRWLSPDPAGMAAVDVTNPQSWNRYAYVLNNPLSNIDITGLECVWDNGSYDAADDPHTGTPGTCEQSGGYWLPHSYFEQNNLADWSPDANSDIANYAQNFTATVIATPCSTKATTGQRVTAGIQGTLNIGLAARKFDQAGTEAAESVVAAPLTEGQSLWGLLKAGYDALSASGQALSGMGQIYIAASSNLQGGQEIQQAGDIISGPLFGVPTLIATKNAATAQTWANRESFLTAGAGFVNSKTITGAIQSTADFGLSVMGLASDDGCN